MASTGIRAALLVAAVAVSLVGEARGASYTVGAPAGSWDLRTNYTSWASGVTLRAGDRLVFKYPRAAHDVLEVNRADYDSCSGSSPLATFATGDDAVPLPAGGVTRYFICGVPGHCDAGMRLAVRVEAAAAAGGAPNAAAAPSPAPVALTPRAAAPGGPAVPPSSSASAAAAQSLYAFSLTAAVVAVGLMALHYKTTF